METHPWKSGGGEYCGSGVGTGEAGDCHPTWSQGGPKGQAFQAKGTEGTTAWMCECEQLVGGRARGPREEDVKVQLHVGSLGCYLER